MKTENEMIIEVFANMADTSTEELKKFVDYFINNQDDKYAIKFAIKEAEELLKYLKIIDKRV